MQPFYAQLDAKNTTLEYWPQGLLKYEYVPGRTDLRSEKNAEIQFRRSVDRPLLRLWLREAALFADADSHAFAIDAVRQKFGSSRHDRRFDPGSRCGIDE